MKDYLKRSIAKLRDDFLSKALYDVLRAVGVVIISYLLLLAIPRETTVGKYLDKTLSISVLQLILFILFTFLLTVTGTYLITQKRFNLIKKDLHSDELTGLPNHRAMNEALRKAVEWAKGKEGNILSVILIDIDNFKKLNDDFGQNTADQILMKLGSLLKSDNRNTDNTYRQHQKGDEFVVVTYETTLSNALLAADRKKNNIAKAGIEIDGFDQPFRITVSCGVAEYNPKKDEADTLLDRAFKAMKEAKSVEGKNTVKALI